MRLCLSNVPRAGRLAGTSVFLLLAACAPGGGREPVQPRTGVLVLAVDALRGDHMASAGYDRPTTPVLDRLASEGVRFDRAFAAAPSEIPGHVALLTGCAPVVARRLIPNEFLAPAERRWRIPRGVPRLAVEFLVAGYRTAAFMDHPRLAPVHGFQAGFETFEAPLEEEQSQRRYLSSRRVVDHFLQWMRNLDSDESWFAYVNLNDLDRLWYSPDPQWLDYFEPRREMRQIPPLAVTDSIFFAVPRTRWGGGSRTLGKYESIYDGHIRRFDDELDRLLASLRVAGRYDETTIAVVGAYGVQLGEAGLILQSGLYSMAELRVPWVIKPAVQHLRGIRIGSAFDEVVSTTDVMPTLLELAGLEPPGGMHGLSQAQRMRGSAPPGGEEARWFVAASCGLQQGCIILSRRYAFEYASAGRVKNLQLRRSWFGEEVDEEGSSGRFYDYGAVPFPPLSAEPTPLNEEERVELERHRLAALRWSTQMRQARNLLQLGQAPDTEEGAALLRKLGELGYVGEDLSKLLGLSLRYPPYVKGGFELTTRDTLESLRARGHEVCVVTARGLEFEPSAELEPCLLPDLDGVDPEERSFHGSNRERFRLHFFRWRNYRATLAAIRAFAPDALLYFNLSHASLAPLVAARRAGLPTLGFVADPWPENHWLREWNRRRADGAKKGWRYALVRQAWLRFRRLVGLGPMLASSESMKAALVADGLPAEMIGVAYLGLPPEMRASASASAPPERAKDETLHVVCLSNLWRGKGQHVLIEALTHLRARDQRVRATLAGGGNPDYVRRIEQALAEGGLADSVRLVGRLDRAGVSALLRSAHVLIMPSLWDEPYGMTTLEGLAHGLPVIASDAGASPELVQHQKDGLLVPAGDPVALAEAIARLAGNEFLRRELGRAGQERVLRDFDHERFVDRIEARLGELVAGLESA